MTHTILLQKLIAIEQAIGSANNSALRELVYDAETYLLEMQKERAKPLHSDPRGAGLRRFHALHNISQDRIAALGRD